MQLDSDCSAIYTVVSVLVICIRQMTNKQIQPTQQIM